MFICLMLICAVSLNAQDTLKREIISKKVGAYHNDNYEKYDYNKNKWYLDDTVITYNYTIRVNSQYASSLYLEQAGRNFVAAGSFLLIGCGVAAIPLFFDRSADITLEKADQNKKNTYVCEAIAGACLITSIACFISGGLKLQKSAITLRSGKNYIIQTEGTNIKIKF